MVFGLPRTGAEQSILTVLWALGLLILGGTLMLFTRGKRGK